MQRLLIGMVIGTAVGLVPAWAMAGNQEVAEQIAANLRQSGQLQHYKIGVKFQDGTAWLRGRVSSPEQMNTTLRLVFRTPGVRRIVNNLEIAAEEKDATSIAAVPSSNRTSSGVKGETVLPQSVESPIQGSRTPWAASNPLRQAAGAFAPERLLRPLAADLTTTPLQRVRPESHSTIRLQQVMANAAQAVKQSLSSQASVEPTTATSRARADRVATSFTPTPAQPTTATAVEGRPTPAAELDTCVRLLVNGSEQKHPRAREPEARAEQMTLQNTPTAVAANRLDLTPVDQATPQPAPATRAVPVPVAYVQTSAAAGMGQSAPAPMPFGRPAGAPIPQYVTPASGVAPARYDQPCMPNYSWPGYAAYPNYAALTYPKQYSPTAWPYIGPFYPYPQVPLGWRKVTLEWHDGWWQLDFDSGPRKHFLSGLFRPYR